MASRLMHLKILLPSHVFADVPQVTRAVVKTPTGFLGLLPHRLDCTAALAPGILTYETQSAGEVYVALDEGVMVKAGMDLLISVRNAIGGTDLGQLHEAVEREFLKLDEREKSVRSVLAKLESSLVRRLVELRHE